MKVVLSLDPDVKRCFQAIGEYQHLPFEDSSIDILRKRYRAVDVQMRLPVADMARVVEDSVAGRTGSIALRRYFARNHPVTPQPAILFFHGGGWVAGDLDSHDEICRHVARITDLQVIAVDYRLAPEHPFPAAVEDSIDSYAMLLERAKEWNVDPRRIAVMGDGTGGTLASIVSLHARDMCQPIPVCQLLFYPVTDMANESASFRDNGGMPGPLNDQMRWLYRQYLAGHGDVREWRASPFHARSMAGLPPTFIAVGTCDPVHDEATALAERLYKAGINTMLRTMPGQVHDYLMMGGMIGEASRSLDAAAAFLRERLNETSAKPRRRKA